MHQKYHNHCTHPIRSITIITPTQINEKENVIDTITKTAPSHANSHIDDNLNKKRVQLILRNVSGNK